MRTEQTEHPEDMNGNKVSDMEHSTSCNMEVRPNLGKTDKISSTW